jgi:NADH-quinone oxidoreductase subunit G
MKVKVNDTELDLAPGTSAIDAVFAAGHDVPYFCSQEYMSPIGACRMCLAKVGAPRQDRATGEWILDEESGEPKIFYFPALMATCTTAIMEGMVIDTLSDEVKQAQNGMVEFTLINHPLDCPVCDKGGACELQDRAYEYGSGLSRFRFDKRHQEKHHALSELITLDRERCIHCKRCVRYFEEVPGDEVLDFIERGGHTYIGTLGEGLPSNFAGNITDICPVGALLDTTSRFRGRNWEYDHTRTTGLDDASGSAIVVDARTGRIERIKAALNTEVNKSWIDDGTRFGHEYSGADDRIKTPLLRKGGELVPVTWEEATNYVKAKLEQMAEKELGIALRADATLEEGVAAKALAEHVQTGQLDHFPRPKASVIPEGDVARLNDLATAGAIFVVGDVSEEVPAVDLRIKDALKGVSPPAPLPHGVPIADLRLKERMPRKRELLTVAAPYRVDLMRHAGRAVSYRVGEEGALLSALTKLATVEDELSEEEVAALGMSIDEGRALVRQLAEAQNAVIVYGSFVLASPAARSAVIGLAKAVKAKVMAMGPMANSYGLEAIGVVPSHARYGYQQMIRGSAKALILSGLDPAQDLSVAETLKSLELLVVHHHFANATTALADVVLPAKTGYEKDGTVVNLEGRYLPVRSAPVDGGQSEDFTGLVRHLGEALGVRLEGRSTRSAKRVLNHLLGIDLKELPEEGLLTKTKSRPPRRVSVKEQGTPSGNLLLVPSMVRPEFLSRNPHLRAVFGDVALSLHPDDAQRLKLVRGDRVRLSVDGTVRKATVRVSEAVPQGLMLLPATPDQPVGLATADISTLAKESSQLEVA